MSDFLKYVMKPLMPKIEAEEFNLTHATLRYSAGMPAVYRPVIATVPAFSHGGYDIVTSNFLTERKQVCFPKSKRKRIQKKWRKRSANWATVPSTQVIVSGRTIYMHPQTLERLKAELT